MMAEKQYSASESSKAAFIPDAQPSIPQRPSSQQIWRHLCYKLTGYVLIVFGGLYLLITAAVAIESVMSREAEGPLSVFAKPPKNLPLSSCPSRVPSKQGYLFGENIYYQFFQQSHAPNVIIEDDKQLCGQGFQGNASLYGLGVRVGLYLLWSAYVIAKYFQLKVASTLFQGMMVYQIISTAIFLSLTLQQKCTFSTEMLIILLLFLAGGSVATRTPKVGVEGAPPVWKGLTFSRLLFELTSYIYVVYLSWFLIWGYDGNFVEMPCGAFDFLGRPTNDLGFRLWRVMMGLYYIMHAIRLSVLLPSSVVVFREEYQQSIREWSIPNRLFNNKHSVGNSGQNAPSSSSPSQHENGPRINSRISGWRRYLRSSLGAFRTRFFEGWLVSPSVAKIINRKTTSFSRLLSLGVLIAGIEKLISANKIAGVHALNSIGQYLSVLIGIGALAACAYSYEEAHLLRKAGFEQHKETESMLLSHNEDPTREKSANRTEEEV